MDRAGPAPVLTAVDLDGRVRAARRHLRRAGRPAPAGDPRARLARGEASVKELAEPFAPDRLVMTEANVDCHARADVESIITIELTGATHLVHTATFPTNEIRDAVAGSGMARRLRPWQRLWSTPWTGRSR